MDWTTIIVTVITTLIGPVMLVLAPMIVTKFFEMHSAQLAVVKQTKEAHKELAAAIILEVEKVYGNLMSSEKLQIAVAKLGAILGDENTEALKTLLESTLVILQKEWGKAWDNIPDPSTLPTLPEVPDLSEVPATTETPITP